MIGKDLSVVAGIEGPRVGRGLVFGKFMPPTDGHLYLVNFAQNCCDHLTIVVSSLPGEPIPGKLRHQWMAEIFPRCKVIHLDIEMPQEPAHLDDLPFFQHWADTLHRISGETRFDALFASESYGYRVADVMKTVFIPVDSRRKQVAISGTEMRKNPFLHWDKLHPVVRPYFVKRVAVAGLPSAEKAALTRALAEHFDTVCAGDYAASLVADFSGNFPDYTDAQLTGADVPTIARGQAASEDSLLRQANRLLFADSEPALTAEWSRRRFQSCPSWVEQAAPRDYALTLLLDPTGFEGKPPLPAPASPFTAESEAFGWWKTQLAANGRKAAVIGGKNWDERLKNAIEAVDQAFFQG